MNSHPDQPDRLMDLIDGVYEAALDEQQWRGLAPRIAQAFGSTSTTLQVQRLADSSQILSMTENVSARIGDYRDHYWQRDIWVERAVQLIGMSRVGSSRHMVSDTEFQETEFYRDWCRHLDVFYVVGAVFPSGPGQLGVLGIHRPRSAGSYQAGEENRVARFLPHLQRALRIRDQLAQAAVQRRVSVETLDRCDTATLLLAADGMIVYANRHAEALLAEGGVLCQRHGRLAAVRSAEQTRLAALVAAAARLATPGHADGVMALRRPRQQPLSVLVAPFRMRWGGNPAAGAIVFVRDPHRSMSALATLRALYRFTPAEARVAQALVNGKSIAEIAAAHRAKVDTIRSQLKIIFAKTGTHRQGQCVAMILRGIATIARE